MTARIALFAMLLTSLAPAISHAVAAAAGSNDQWVQVCTALGLKLVKFGGDGAPESPSPSGSHFEHCPFCLKHIGAIGILPAAVPELAVAPGAETFPELYFKSHRPLFTCAAAQPRAPPSAS